MEAFETEDISIKKQALILTNEKMDPLSCIV